MQNKNLFISIQQDALTLLGLFMSSVYYDHHDAYIIAYNLEYSCTWPQ